MSGQAADVGKDRMVETFPGSERVFSSDGNFRVRQRSFTHPTVLQSCVAATALQTDINHNLI